ncbi:hypothetical protein AYI71_02075 [Limosilactobacillus oris]|nr:hypothetical protein AYI71_02075 [Limosilactobacillus oris]
MAQEFSVEAVLSAVDKSFSSTMNQALNNVYKLGQSTNNTAGGVRSAGGSMMGTFKGVAAGMGAVQIASKAFDVVKGSISGAVSRIDTLANSSRVFNNMGFGANQTKAAMLGLQDSIKGLPTSLDSAVQGVQILAASTGNLKQSQQVYSALNDSIIGFGGSTADVQNAVIQLSQAFANGKVDGMTWISMMNSNMGPVLNAIAKKMGMTTAELKDGLSSGKISVEDFQKALIDLDKNGGGGLKSLHKIAQDSTAGIGTSLENAKTAITRGVGDMIKSFNDFSQQVTGSGIAEHIANIGTLAEQGLQQMGTALRSVAPLVKGVVETLKATFNNKIFQGAAIGVLGFIGAFKSINGVIAIVMRLRSTFVALSVIAKAGNLAMAFSEAMSTLAKSSKIAAAAQAAFNAVMNANPLVRVISIIAAVVAALVFFFTKTKTGQQIWASFVSFLSSAWQTLKSVASTVWNAIASFVTGAVEKIKAVWQPIGEFFGNLWNTIKEVAVGAWNGFISSIQPIVEAFKNLWSALSDFFGTLWQGIVAIATPIWQALVVVIGAIVVVIMGIWQGLSAFFSVLWQGIVAVATPIWQILVTVIQGVWTVIVAMWQNFVTIMATIWQNVVTVAQTVWQVLVTVISAVWNIIVTVVSTAINVVAGIIQAVTAAIQGDWSGAWNAIMGVASTIWNGIESIVSTVMNAIKSVISSLMNGIKSVFSNGWNAAKTVTSNGINACKNAVANIAKTMVSVGQDFVNGFIKGLTSKINDAVEAVMSLGHKAVSAAKSFFKIGSPSRVMMQYGQWFTEGFAIGVTDEIRMVKQAVTAMSKAAMVNPSLSPAGFQDSLSRLNGSVSGNYNGTLTMQDSTLQMQNNQLLRQLVDKSGDVYMDGTPVGHIVAPTVSQDLGQGVSLKGRWS